MKKVLIALILALFVLTLYACGKKTILTECEVCGETKNCYELVITKIDDKDDEEFYYVCSKECENFLCNLATLAGGVKKR